MNYRLRLQSQPLYVHEIRGVCFLSWVLAQDRANAAVFTKDIERWCEIASNLAGEPVLAEPI